MISAEGRAPPAIQNPLGAGGCPRPCKRSFRMPQPLEAGRFGDRCPAPPAQCGNGGGHLPPFGTANAFLSAVPGAAASSAVLLFSFRW
jgi:hypothetical protein